MVPANEAVMTVNSNNVSICSGLAAIWKEMFKAISGRISQTVIDTA